MRYTINITSSVYSELIETDFLTQELTDYVLAIADFIKEKGGFAKIYVHEKIKN